MRELAFPILGSAIVLVLVLPASALLAKGLLRLSERAFGPLHGIGVRFAIIVGSSFLPLAWLLSAGIHQAETGRGVVACLIHPAEGACAEPALFAALLLSVVALLIGWRASGARARTGAPLDVPPRIARALEEPALSSLRGRVIVRDDADAPISTRGILRPRVILRRDLADKLDDGALIAALAHEASHLHAGDSVRYLLVDLALALNPLGRVFLRPELARWIHAREIHCDREAVLRGASPEALAHALVVAARPASVAPELGAGNVHALRQRVALLLAYSERAPIACCERSVSFPALVVLAIVILLPHAAGTHALDALHAGSELVLLYLPR